MNPTLQTVHNVNEPLTDFSLMFLQKDGFVADKVFPIKEVPHQASSYFTYPRGSFNTPQMKQRAPGTEVQMADYDIELATYTTTPWALGRSLDEQIEANADQIINLELEATEFLTLQLLLNKETNWSTAFFSGTGTWTNNFTGNSSPSVYGSSTVEQWNMSGSTPIEDIEQMKQQIMLSSGNVGAPNTLVLGYPVYKALLTNPELMSRIVYGQKADKPAVLNAELMAEMFGVERVLVSTAVYNTAAYGATESNAYVLGKHALLAYVPAVVGVRTPAAGLNFTWSKYGPSRVVSYPWIITRSTRVEMESAYAYNLVSADLGGFFYEVVA